VGSIEIISKAIADAYAQGKREREKQATVENSVELKTVKRDEKVLPEEKIPEKISETPSSKAAEKPKEALKKRGRPAKKVIS